MGGFGSGRYGGRPTADASCKIDLAWMMREGLAKEGRRSHGTLQWTCRGQPNGSISYLVIMDEPGEERLELSYTRGPEGKREDVRQTVRLTFTRPKLGGKRWWMICPFRGLRVGKLYKPPGGDRFASRQAWRLGYQSQRIAANERTFEALFRLQAKLGCKPGVGNWPFRPKGMWQRTFDRHMERFWALDYQTGREMVALLEKLKGRCAGLPDLPAGL